MFAFLLGIFSFCFTSFVFTHIIPFIVDEWNNVRKFAHDSWSVTFPIRLLIGIPAGIAGLIILPIIVISRIGIDSLYSTAVQAIIGIAVVMGSITLLWLIVIITVTLLNITVIIKTRGRYLIARIARVFCWILWRLPSRQTVVEALNWAIVNLLAIVLYIGLAISCAALHNFSSSKNEDVVSSTPHLLIDTAVAQPPELKEKFLPVDIPEEKDTVMLPPPPFELEWVLVTSPDTNGRWIQRPKK